MLRISRVEHKSSCHPKVLLRRNAKVYLAARSKRKGEEAIASLKAETGNEAIFLELDLSSLASVKKASAEFMSKDHELHMLFNNACVCSPSSSCTRNTSIPIWPII